MLRLSRPLHPRLGGMDAAETLCLAATPVFAIMAGLTAVLGGPPDMLCLTAPDTAPLGGRINGMVPMYLLMSVFHAAPWLKLIMGEKT